MTPTPVFLPRHGKSEQVAIADVRLGELIYLTDKECLAVGDGKGGYIAPVNVVKGPDNGIYIEFKDIKDELVRFVPIYIKHDF